MKRKIGLGAAIVAAVAAIAGLVLLVHGEVFAVLDPKGVIAAQQRTLIVVVTLMMLLVIVPVFVMTFTIAWKYRASNTKARYQPEWDHHRVAETVWWGIPILLIAILAGVIIKSSHDLDPSRPIASNAKPVTIQVVALEWKWLFIYPEQNIATVNYVQFPVDRPVDFKITSDAPMNSFWIPQLGGQIYAMSGMQTQLNLMATSVGRYNGSSANLSGKGFADMRFIAEAVSDQSFAGWVASVKSSHSTLDKGEYAALATPSTVDDPLVYASADQSLYDTIIMKYMEPEPTPASTVSDTSTEGEPQGN